MPHLPNSNTEEAKPLTRGEKIFDWLTYGGIAGVGTFLLTIPVAYWAKYGKGAARFEGATKWLQKQGLSAQTAEQMMMTNATMQGGNLTVLPVKWMEDNKIACIQKINDIIGDPTDVAALEKEDKQSWSSIIKARVMAWLVVFTSLKGAAHVIGGDKFAAFEDAFAKNIVCKPLGAQTHINGKETKPFRYGKIAAIDTFATTAATILLFIGSRMFAHWERKEEPQPAETAPVHPPIPIQPEIKPDVYRPNETVAKILKEKPSETFAALAKKQAASATLAI